MKNSSLFLFLSLFSFKALAQENLISNPSFEEWDKSLPQTHISIHDLVKDWEEVSIGEVQYVHPKLSFSKPSLNPFGKQNARTGKGLIVMKWWAIPSHGIGDLTPYYLQTKLKKKLEAGKEYQLEYWVSLAENAGLVTEEFSAYFFENQIQGKKNKKEGIPKYSKKISSGGVLDLLEMVATTKLYYRKGWVEDKENWTKISYTFTATGKENYLVLGDFGQPNPNRCKKIPHKLKFHYNDALYFIDDVSLIQIPEKQQLDSFPMIASSDSLPMIASSEKIEKELEEKKELILPHVLFGNNQSQLTAQARQELDSVAVVLNKKATWQIDIEGHTDNQGDSLANLSLSMQRAISVANYLVSRKIDNRRMNRRGYGNQMPLLPNTTPRGRSRNRRVVIRLRK
jgi:OmpA-OmpF porin, OOP family